MKVEIIKCLKDNYSYLLINEKNKNACVIDPSESRPIIDFVEKKNINLKFILNTHHHYDHVGGNNDLKKKYGSNIVGFKNDNCLLYTSPSPRDATLSRIPAYA